MRTLAIALSTALALLLPPALAQAPKDQRSTPKAAKVAAEGQGLTQERPTLVKLIPAEPGAAEAEKRASEDKQKAEELRIDHEMLQHVGHIAFDSRATMWATALMFIATLGLFTVAAFQYRDSKEAVAAATKSADAAVKAADIAERTAERQLRAYVNVTPVDRLRLDDEGRILVDLQIGNDGQTPAHKVTCDGCILFDDLPRSPDKPWPTLPYKTNSSLSSSQQAIQSLRNSVRLTPEQREQLQAKTHAVYVRALVTYLDVFDKEHVTQLVCFASGRNASTGELQFSLDGNFSN